MSLRVLADFLTQGDAALGLPRPTPAQRMRRQFGLPPHGPAAPAGTASHDDASAHALAARDWQAHVDAGRMGGAGDG